MAYRVLLLVLMLFSMSQVASAKDVVVVLEPTGRLPLEILKNLSDKTRQGAIEGLPAAHFSILTRENMISYAASMDIDLSNCKNECEVETGRELNAAYVVSGSVINVSGVWELTLKAYDTKGGDFLGLTSVRGDNELALVDGVQAAAKKLFKTKIASRISGAGGSLVGTGGAVKLGELKLGEEIVNEETDQASFLSVSSEPAGATLYINGKEKGVTPYEELMPWGRYKLTLDKGLYHPDQKEVVIDSEQTRAIHFDLKPAFGGLSVVSVPSGAEVYLNGELAGKTPLKLSRKPSGVYGIRIEAPHHNAYTDEIKIEDQKEAKIEAELGSSVGSISIVSRPSGAQVRLNGEVVGTTPYRVQRKPPGEYTVQVSKPKYLSQEIQFRLSEGDQYEETIVLPSNFGSLTVRSKPSGARIELGGKKTGKTTPHTFQGVQSGAVRLAISAPGYGTWRGQARIEVNKNTVVEESLDAKTGTLMIRTVLPDDTPCRGEVTVDGKAIGQAPMVHTTVATIPHNIKAVCQGMDATKRVTVEHNARLPVVLKVANFSLRDLYEAESRLKGARTLDMLGFVGSAAAFAGAGVSIGTANNHFAAAADISSSNSAETYEEHRSQGTSLQATGIVLGVAGTGILTAAIWHKLTRTKKKSAEVQYIREQRGW